MQGVLNRYVSDSWGLVWAVFLNAVFFWVVSAALLTWLYVAPESLPEYLRMNQLSIEKFKWWFLIPSFCGFCIVLCLPWSIQELGPSKTFICMIAAQIVFGLLAEKFIFDAHLSFSKLLGAGLAMAGAALVMYSPNS